MTAGAALRVASRACVALAGPAETRDFPGDAPAARNRARS